MRGGPATLWNHDGSRSVAHESALGDGARDLVEEPHLHHDRAAGVVRGRVVVVWLGDSPATSSIARRLEGPHATDQREDDGR
jgi:hypothetical protein